MKLTPHFTLDEMVKSQTALRLGLDNTPDTDEMKSLLALCENVLEPVRIHWAKPVVVNSGFRALRVNRAIGSRDSSQHAKGEAADIEIPGISNQELADFINDNLSYDQAIY